MNLRKDHQNSHLNEREHRLAGENEAKPKGPVGRYQRIRTRVREKTDGKTENIFKYRLPEHSPRFGERYPQIKKEITPKKSM